MPYPPDTAEMTKAYGLYTRLSREDMQWMGSEEARGQVGFPERLLRGLYTLRSCLLTQLL